MGANKFYQYIGIGGFLSPLNRKLDKKVFYEHADVNKKGKDAITKYIQRMELAYLLTPSTVNIQPFKNDEYHFEGIMFITVFLRDEITDKIVSIIEDVIHSALPNPAVLIFDWEDEIQISTSMKRLSKSDKTSIVLGDIHRSDWLTLQENNNHIQQFFKEIHLTNVRFTNFFDFYQDYDIAVEALQNLKITGQFQIAESPEGYKKQQDMIREIQQLEQEIAKIRAKMKKETQFNKKVEYNLKIQKLTQETATLKEQLVE